MSELQQENPDAWKVEKAKKDFDPGVYDQILKEYPGIQVDPHPGRKEKPIVTYN